MKGCYIYVLNPPDGTCHRFHLEDEQLNGTHSSGGKYPVGFLVYQFLEDKGFRYEDVDYIFSQEELIHEG